jgi:hypothetical protein
MRSFGVSTAYPQENMEYFSATPLPVLKNLPKSKWKKH